jgi:1-acyl-sn-glycerol-3-phosphate acyltransferase
MNGRKIVYSYLPAFLKKLDFLGLFEKDPFGNSLLLKRIMIFILGWFTYYRFTAVNRIKIEGMEHLAGLPDQGVLFLCNHQTYFADVMSFYHVFCAAKWGYNNTISPPFYLFSPRARIYYVAAAETMKEGGLLPRIFTAVGAILVERSWRASGENVKRELDNTGQQKIRRGLDHGWVISFPQGTTKPYAPVRKGTAYMIKEHNPVVVPIVINGFRRAFDKKGLRFKKRNTLLTVEIQRPLAWTGEEAIDEIVDKVTVAIRQVPPPGMKASEVD